MLVIVEILAGLKAQDLAAVYVPGSIVVANQKDV